MVPGSGGGPSASYVQVAKRVRLGPSATEFSFAISMEGYNSVYVECTVFAAVGAPDPLLKIYVQVSNDGQNWTTLPIGGTPVFGSTTTIGYFKLDQAAIGQQISAAHARLMYVTDSSTTAVIFSAGLDRKRTNI
jgi:hypothetical protein